jgi:hypothetical protein
MRCYASELREFYKEHLPWLFFAITLAVFELYNIVVLFSLCSVGIYDAHVHISSRSKFGSFIFSCSGSYGCCDHCGGCCSHKSQNTQKYVDDLSSEITKHTFLTECVACIKENVK